MLDTLPEQGFTFWPVGNGDSTTVTIDDETVIQIDLHNLEAADDDDDPRTPILDRLPVLLPEVDDKPYLSVFVLTHPDNDHCLGFAELLKTVTIGEIWFSPRVFREYTKDLCDDAVAFRDEAKRRVAKTIQDGEVSSGDRVRIIGYSELLEEDDYKGFPDDKLTVPGNPITEVDGDDKVDSFRAFIHAPFKDDEAGDRNDTSIGMQMTLKNGDGNLIRAMLLGDLSYPVVSRVFDVSERDDLEWEVFLAPHHCSKSVMYWKGENDEKENLQQGLLDQIKDSANSDFGYVISSSNPIPSSNKDGDNPPHRKAADRYEEIVPTRFLCTQEHPNEEEPEPIVFELADDVPDYHDPSDDSDQSSSNARSLKRTVVAARGSDAPSKDPTRFGSFL